MPILSHIGIWPIPKGFTSVQYFRVSLIFIIIVNYWIIYHFISITCSIGSMFFPSLFLLIKRQAAQGFWRLCLYCLEQNQIEVIMTGDELGFSESAILIVNHKSLNDFFIMSYLIRILQENQNIDTKPVSPRLNFFTWATIWKVPTIRLLFNILSYDENWELNDSDLKYQLLKINDNYEAENKTDNMEFNNYPEWLVLFPEVNIFSKTIQLLQKNQINKYFLPDLNNLLYPRFKSFNNTITMIKQMNLNIPRVYSVTIQYYDKVSKKSISPSLFQLFGEYPSKIAVRLHIKSKLLSRIPWKERKLEKWLENEWVIKDKLLDNMDKNIDNFI